MATTQTIARTRERALLKAARDGKEDAFRQLVEPYHGELRAHCYRMLGSLHDAEDSLQDTMLRAWRALGRFEGRSSLRSWLYTIATNTCLNAIAKRPKRVLPIDYGPATDPHVGPGEPLVESVWIEPFPDEQLAVEDGLAAPEASYEQREGLELAFVAALQHLAPNQRAALILREVLGFSAREVAATLETSVASVNSALQRARKTVEDKLPDRSQQKTLRVLGDEKLRVVVEAYIDAMQRGDVEQVVGMLTEDAAWSMPPLASWFGGREEISIFLANGPLSGRIDWRRVATHANGQPAVAAYTWDEVAGCYLPFALDVLTFDGDRISDVTAFITRSIEFDDRETYQRWNEQPADAAHVEAFFTRFGLPPRIDR